MDKSIIAALISGLFAISSPLITFVFVRKYDQRELREIKKSESSAITGVWQGRLEQTLYDKSISMDVHFIFSSGKKVVDGVIKLKNPVDNSPIELSFTGGFYHGRFIKLDYTNSDTRIRQFGAMVMSLNDNADELTGKYTGYGSLSNKIINGEIILKRAFD